MLAGNEVPNSSYTGELGVYDSDSCTNSNKHTLVVLRGTVNDKPVSCLVDSGATHNFLSLNWTARAGCVTSPLPDKLHVNLADGRKMLYLSEEASVELCIGDFRSSLQGILAPIDKYDIILGKPWLCSVNPRIDFRTNQVELIPGTSKLHTGASDLASSAPSTLNAKRTTALNHDVDDSFIRDDAPEELFFMNVTSARKAIKKGASWYMIRIHEREATAELNLLELAIGVSGPQQEELAKLMKRHSDILSKELPCRLPPLRRVNHEIEVEPGSTPPSRPPFRLSQPELDELHHQLDEMLKRGFIRPSKSPYGAPVFFVKKADGTLRMVCDWRQLNKVTVKTQACLPSIEDLFDAVRGAKYFSKLDLKAGYNQVRVEDQDIPKTAINTPFGHFEFTVMGFGLTNAPATFMALMNDVLRPFLRKFLVVFLDDILVFSRSWTEHLTYLDAVLAALKEQSLFCNFIKCEFALSSIKFLGHIVSGTSLKPDPEKLTVVQNWKTPTSVTEVRQFLGFTIYFRRFIDHYSFIARPLEELTGKYARFSWSKQCHDAFAHLKESLISAPVLRLPDVERKFRLITDACDSAVAGVLLQQDDDKEWHPVAYTSRRLRPEERNYHANERETLAVLHALRVWRTYLFKHFQLLTDNQGVTYLLSKKHLSGREARWLDTLANFNMSITHKPGKDNVADPLSRALDTSPLPSPHDLETNASLGSVIGEFCQDDETKEQLFKAYHEDVYFKNIIAKLEEDSRNAWKKRYFWSKEKGLFLLEDPVWRLCIPKGSLRLKLLRMYHQSASSCHPGRERTSLRRFLDA